jgi:hypothetical protein
MACDSRSARRARVTLWSLAWFVAMFLLIVAMVRFWSN